GTNATPFLFRKIRYENTAGNRLREAVWRFGPTTMLARRGFAQRLLMPAGYNPRQAVLGFHALGPSANPAIPGLVAMLDSVNEEWGLRALCYIGSDSIEPLK